MSMMKMPKARKTYVEFVNKWCHLFYIQTYRPAHRLANSMAHIPIQVVLQTQNTLAKESNDLAKVLLEPNQKSNELSMNTKPGQRFTPDDRRHLRKF